VIHAELESFLGAVRFFTRLPVPAWVGHSAEGLNRSARYFPAVGLLIGGLAAAAFWLAALVLPKSIAVLAAMGITLLATGAFHEDGLSDAADGLGGGREKRRILEIMKDSRVGSYGVVALWLALTAKFAALYEAPAAWLPLLLLAGHAWSRLVSTALLATMDYVREDMESKSKPLATRLSAGSFAVAVVFGTLPLFFLPLLAVAGGMLASVLATFWLAAKFRRWLGGYTGDCLGAVQQVAEVTFYIGCLCAFTS